MKLLTLIRHSKSSWGDHTLPDHDRPLNDRGKKAAPMMGRVLAEKGYDPDAIICSTAKRARSTAKAIAKELGFPKEKIQLASDLYAAGVPALIQVIGNIGESLASAVLIGHNPGFEDLANTLVPGDPVAHLPTCAVVHMKLNVDHWGEADADCAELIEFLYPKMFDE